MNNFFYWKSNFFQSSSMIQMWNSGLTNGIKWFVKMCEQNSWIKVFKVSEKRNLKRYECLVLKCLFFLQRFCSTRAHNSRLYWFGFTQKDFQIILINEIDRQNARQILSRFNCETTSVCMFIYSKNKIGIQESKLN